MSETLSLEQSYDALRNDVVRFVSTCDVVRVDGPDARTYLDGQCSQSLLGLEPGDSAETLLLSPQGKLDAYARVAIALDGAALVIVDAGYGEAVLERLRRFKLRVKVNLELSTEPLVALRGRHVKARETLENVAVLGVNWPGLVGLDLVGPDALSPACMPDGDLPALEVAGIEAGLPKMGREITEKVIPQETGIVDRTVSFTKGCYTGQELVARIDSRGNNVARRLRGAVFDHGAGLSQLEKVTAIHVDGVEVGQLTSVAYSPGSGGVVGLCYVKRAVSPPARGSVVLTDGQSVTVMIEELPLYRS